MSVNSKTCVYPLSMPKTPTTLKDLSSNVTFRTTCTQDSKQVTVQQSISWFVF